MVSVKALKTRSRNDYQNSCPRCGQVLRMTYQDREPECWICGYADYTHTPLTQSGESILASGTRFLVRYVGKFPEMKNKLVYFRLARGGGTAIARSLPHCPFCDQVMEVISLVGKHKTISEDRYQCEQGHRISLLRDLKGDMGWK